MRKIKLLNPNLAFKTGIFVIFLLFSATIWAEPRPEGALDVKISPLFEARHLFFNSGLSTPERIKIHDADTWKTQWNRLNAHLTPLPPLPGVDFSAETIIVASLGTQKTGGHLIRVPEAWVADGVLFVVVETIAPPPDMATSQALTSPVFVGKAPGIFDKVEFIERTAPHPVRMQPYGQKPSQNAQKIAKNT